MAAGVHLREVTDSDLERFFEQQLDARANFMAAFTAADPSDRAAFDAKWTRIRNDARCAALTVVADGDVAGHVGAFDRDGVREVTYWLGVEYWGRGIATAALTQFLQLETTRPVYARVAGDNIASLTVLQRCGFEIVGQDRGYAAARQAEITEFVLRLP